MVWMESRKAAVSSSRHRSAIMITRSRWLVSPPGLGPSAAAAAAAADASDARRASAMKASRSRFTCGGAVAHVWRTGSRARRKGEQRPHPLQAATCERRLQPSCCADQRPRPAIMQVSGEEKPRLSAPSWVPAHLQLGQLEALVQLVLAGCGGRGAGLGARLLRARGRSGEGGHSSSKLALLRWHAQAAASAWRQQGTSRPSGAGVQRTVGNEAPLPSGLGRSSIRPNSEGTREKEPTPCTSVK